jgi:hypothetical protein
MLKEAQRIAIKKRVQLMLLNTEALKKVMQSRAL